MATIKRTEDGGPDPVQSKSNDRATTYAGRDRTMGKTPDRIVDTKRPPTARQRLSQALFEPDLMELLEPLVSESAAEARPIEQADRERAFVDYANGECPGGVSEDQRVENDEGEEGEYCRGLDFHEPDYIEPSPDNEDTIDLTGGSIDEEIDKHLEEEPTVLNIEEIPDEVQAIEE